MGTVLVVPQLLAKTAMSADTNNIFIFFIYLLLLNFAAKLLIIYEMTMDIGKKVLKFMDFIRVGLR